jgi:hypothetical protein
MWVSDPGPLICWGTRCTGKKVGRGKDGRALFLLLFPPTSALVGQNVSDFFFDPRMLVTFASIGDRADETESLTYESWLISRVFVGPRLLQIYNRAI